MSNDTKVAQNQDFHFLRRGRAVDEANLKQQVTDKSDDGKSVNCFMYAFLKPNKTENDGHIVIPR